MMFMADSDRAAELAREHSLPVGLHLNLTQRLDSPVVPTAARDRQARAVRAFSRYRLHNWVLFPKRWLSYPWLRRLVDGCILDQFEEFRRLYGRPPTHLDGHHHVHLCPTVTVSEAIPRGQKIRNTHRFGVRQRVVRERFTSPDLHVCMQELRPFGASTLEEKLVGSDGCAVEFELHPALGEHGYLMSDHWGEAIAGRRLGSFAEL
jgi:chitin disaccharide deacetylase